MIPIPDNKILRYHPENHKIGRSDYSIHEQVAVKESLHRFKWVIIASYPHLYDKVGQIPLTYHNGETLLYVAQERFVCEVLRYLSVVELKLCVKACNYIFIQQNMVEWYGDIDINEVKKEDVE